VSKRTNVAFDPSASCPTFDRFLAHVQPEDGSRRLLQQLAGICLHGKPLIQKLIFMHGCGANGKSTFMEVLAWVLGDYAAAIATETLMTTKRDPSAASPDLMRLKGARLAFCNETGEGRHLDSTAVKQMTGFDTLTARPLYGAPVQFAPSHKLVMTGNHRPIVRETGAPSGRVVVHLSNS
jgi:putative DNA primase/helicase